MADEPRGGIGQGLAQVLDTSRSYGQFIAGQERMRQQQAKRQTKEEEFLAGAADMLKSDVWFRDMPEIQGQIQKYVEHHRANADLIAGGDFNKQYESATMQGDILRGIQESIDAKEDFNAQVRKYQENPGAYEDIQGVTKEILDTPFNNQFRQTGILRKKPERLDVNTYLDKNLDAFRQKRGAPRFDPELDSYVTTQTEGIKDFEGAVRSLYQEPRIQKEMQLRYDELSAAEKRRILGPEQLFYEIASERDLRDVTTTLGRSGDEDKDPDRRFTKFGIETPKYRFTIKEGKKEAAAPALKSGKFKAPAKVQTVKIDVDALKTKGEIGDLEFPFKRGSARGVLTEVKRGPDGKWIAKFKLSQDFGPKEDQYGDLVYDKKKGEEVEVSYDSASQEIIGKYGEDLPSIYEEFKGGKESQTGKTISY